jgi:hypothetical protein
MSSKKYGIISVWGHVPLLGLQPATSGCVPGVCH